MDGELVVLQAGMNANELVQIVEHLIDAHPRRFVRLSAEKTEVTPGNLNAVARLPPDDAQPFPDEFQIRHLQPRGLAEPAVEHLDETADDGERAVDVVDDAGVNVASRLGNLLLDALVLQFGQELLDFFRAAVNFAFQRAPLHCLADRGANDGDVKRFVDVVARAQPQGLADRVRGFERRDHDRLDVGIHVFEAFEHFDA